MRSHGTTIWSVMIVYIFNLVAFQGFFRPLRIANFDGYIEVMNDRLNTMKIYRNLLPRLILILHSKSTENQFLFIFKPISHSLVLEDYTSA